MNNSMKVSIAAVIMALGMIFSSMVLSKFFVRIKHEQAIKVKGYSERDVTSDIGKFSCNVSARGFNLNEAYRKLHENKNAVLEYLKQKGFTEPEEAVGTIDISKVNKRDNKGNLMNQIEFYDVSQSIWVASNKVALIKEAATGVTELIQKGIEVSSSSPEFYVSDLKETKIQLLADATKDAHRRAVTLAQNSGGRVGDLISADQGVFQITRKNSTDTSSWGVYDTTTIDKTAKIVVTLEYAIGR